MTGRSVHGAISVPLGGVIYAPVTDLLYFAWQGGGAYRQEGRQPMPARCV